MTFFESHKNRGCSGVDVNDQMVNTFSIVRLRDSGIKLYVVEKSDFNRESNRLFITS